MSEFFLQLGSVLKYAGLLALPLFLVPFVILLLPSNGASKLGARICAVIDKVNGGFLKAAMACAVLVVLSQIALIIGRYVFGWSRNWLGETVIFSFAAMFLLAAAGTLRDDAHVRVDILRTRMSPRTRAWVELAGIYLLLVPMALLIIWASVTPSFVRAWRDFQGSGEADGLPIWFIFKTFIPLFAVLLTAQGLSRAIKMALGLTGKIDLEDLHAAEPGAA